MAQIQKQTTEVQGGVAKVFGLKHWVHYSVGQKSTIGSTKIGNKTIVSGFIHPPLYNPFETNKKVEPKIYPNPFKKSFTIEFPDNNTTKLFLALYDLGGMLVFQEEYQLQGNRILITPPLHLSEGGYFVNIEYNELIYQQHLIHHK